MFSGQTIEKIKEYVLRILENGTGSSASLTNIETKLDTINTSISNPTPALSYFSTELSASVKLGTINQGVRLYSIFVIGSGNTAGFIQLWSQDAAPIIKATYPIGVDGNIPVNFGDGVDFLTGLTVVWSDVINEENLTEAKYLFNIKYKLL